MELTSSTPRTPSSTAPDFASAWRPVVFSPNGSARSLDSWLPNHVDEVRRRLAITGAVLLRGFAPATPAQFAAAVRTVGGPLGENYEGPSPRSALAPGVYSASEVWAPLVVAEHAEMSYLAKMPRFIYFWCRTPATAGGATTLVDGRRVLARLDPRVVAELSRAPVRIRRRHAPPRGRKDPFELKAWPSLFGTEDPHESVRRAEALGYRARIERSGAMTLEQTQPLVRVHPVTGEPAWLNHLLVFHASAAAATLHSAYRTDGRRIAGAFYPLARAYRGVAERLGFTVASDVTFDDNRSIPDALVAEVRRAVTEETYALAWRANDIVLVDNHLMLHGRRPFRGPREVIVAWSEARA